MHKALVPFVFFYLSSILFGYVCAINRKTLRIDRVSFRALPAPGQSPSSAMPEIERAIIIGKIVEDNLPVQLDLSANELARLGREVLELSIEIDNVEVDQRFLAYSPEPLPRAIPTRDPDAASSASNDFYDRAIQLGYAADESQKNKFVLSRPFDLRVGYFSGKKYYLGRFIIDPEDLEGVDYYFVSKASMRLEVPLDES